MCGFGIETGGRDLILADFTGLINFTCLTGLTFTSLTVFSLETVFFETEGTLALDLELVTACTTFFFISGTKQTEFINVEIWVTCLAYRHNGEYTFYFDVYMSEMSAFLSTLKNNVFLTIS